MKRYLYITGAGSSITAGVIGIARADHFPSRYGYCMRGGSGGFPLCYSRASSILQTHREQRSRRSGRQNGLLWFRCFASW